MPATKTALLDAPAIQDLVTAAARDRGHIDARIEDVGSREGGWYVTPANRDHLVINGVDHGQVAFPRCADVVLSHVLTSLGCA